jgi:hypothetical protein
MTKGITKIKSGDKREKIGVDKLYMPRQCKKEEDWFMCNIGLNPMY